MLVSVCVSELHRHAHSLDGICVLNVEDHSDTAGLLHPLEEAQGLEVGAQLVELLGGEARVGQACRAHVCVHA